MKKEDCDCETAENDTNEDKEEMETQRPGRVTVGADEDSVIPEIDESQENVGKCTFNDTEAKEGMPYCFIAPQRTCKQTICCCYYTLLLMKTRVMADTKYIESPKRMAERYKKRKNVQFFSVDDKVSLRIPCIYWANTDQFPVCLAMLYIGAVNKIQNLYP